MTTKKPDYPAILRRLKAGEIREALAAAEHDPDCPVALADTEPERFGPDAGPPVCECLVGEAADLEALAGWLAKNIQSLLSLASGGPRPCSGCDADVYWIMHSANGRRAPYTAAGLNHFADCPNAGNFRGRK